jgi:hypothetical protein
MSSSQTINLCGSVSVETPAKSIDEILFNTVATRMQMPINTDIPVVWGINGVTQITFEKYMKETSCLERINMMPGSKAIRDVRFVEGYFHELLYDISGVSEIKEFEKYKLFRQIVKKRKMTFSEDMFTVYKEWSKTYVPQGKESRAKRMHKFLDMHGCLFIFTL